MAVTDARLNKNIKLAPHDTLMAKTILKLFPRTVKPNDITVLRFFMSPVVFWLFWTHQYEAGFGVFLFAALTDAIDGSMARTRKQITVWGTVYDGVADKVLIGGVLLILVLQHLGAVLTGLIMAVELITAASALYYYKWKKVVRPANLWGKLKMNFQVFGTLALLVKIIWGLQVFAHIAFWLFIGSLLASLVSISAHARERTA